ncbi:PGF-CTERM sorting domain-containing protein [Natronomonas salina]|uniref:DUF7282 domain-containing protein n=1 Tax=Natronomonas salina TaxID=1710540 RepID=UPI0015B75351|nr:BGTF surface domain-containing protein [Natronomonas salina]QLD91157.1 PGF-CTERM sorting domain-containing protein [Natronomonas salina]
MTRNNNKLRAAFFAALMVLWVFSGAVAFGGSAVAQGNLDDASDQADDTWETQSGKWQGQSLYFEPADDPTTTTYTIREYDSQSSEPVGQAVRRVAFSQTDDTNEYYAHIDTSDFEGEYVITKDGRSNEDVVETGADGAESGLNTDDTNEAIEFLVQDLDASWSPDAVSQEGTSELELSTGRSAEHNLEISSDNLSVGQLQNLFNNADYEETDDGIIVPTTSDDLTANVGQADIEPGDYVFNVDVTDTSASDTATLTVDEDIDADADFTQPVFEEARGDNATISLESQELETFNVTVGNSDDVSYEANLVVSPNEDGEVVINMNTYEAGGWNDAALEEVFTAEEGTIETDHRATERVDGTENPLEMGLYDIVASNPADNEEYDVAALDIQERSTDGLTVHTAPDYSELSSAAEIREGQEDGSVTESSDIAMQDALLVEVEASGIYGLFGAQMDNPEQFLATENGLDLTIEQTNPGTNQAPTTVNLEDSTTRVIQDADNDTFYVAIDTAGLQPDGDISEGDEFNASFDVTSEYEYIESSDDVESVNDDFGLVERSAEFDTEGDEVVVSASENAEISGETSVAPGTEFNIRARATGENPFLKTATATVGEDGTFSGEFDFSDVESEQEFQVTIPNENFDSETPGRVGEAAQASVSLSDVEAEGDEVSSVTVDSVDVPQGGFVAIHDSSLEDGAAFDSYLGSSEYLSEGENSDVEVQLDEPITEETDLFAVVYQDTNDNQEFDFVDSEGDDDSEYTDEDGEAISDSASVTFSDDTNNGTETPTGTEEAPGGDDTETATDDSGSDDGGEDQAGFGAVIALIALLGAALLAARRNDF